MSTVTLSTIQELVERSLFERLRLECVDKGYTADITAFPETPAGYAAYQAAIEAIRNSVGFAIEIFNNQDNQNTGQLKVPRITIVPQPFMEGSLGGDQTRRYVKDGPAYNAEVLPPQTSDYYCNIHLTGTTAAQMRILNAILSLSVPTRGWIPWLPNTLEGNFFAKRIGYFQNAFAEKGATDLVYRYQIPDLFETDCEIVATGLSPLKQITLNTKVEDVNGNTTDAGNTVIP